MNVSYIVVATNEPCFFSIGNDEVDSNLVSYLSKCLLPSGGSCVAVFYVTMQVQECFIGNTFDI